MKIAVMGTGIVGQTLAAKLSDLGQAVIVGTRDVSATLARSTAGPPRNPPFHAWKEQHPQITLMPFQAAAVQAELVINATSGHASVQALQSAGSKNLERKILIDVANPLDFSRGMPPSLSVCNTDSLGEQIQKAFPKAKVVKTLNTVNAELMTNPMTVAGGDHHMFVCGNDAQAKAEVTRILTEWFGWNDVIDLGDITSARAMEMVLPIWIRLMTIFQTPMFNFKVVR